MALEAVTSDMSIKGVVLILRTPHSDRETNPEIDSIAVEFAIHKGNLMAIERLQFSTLTGFSRILSVPAVAFSSAIAPIG